MKKIVFILYIISTILYAQEPSAFGAGNLDSPIAYGLDENEKVIVKNKKSIRSLSSQIESLQDELESLKLISKNINTNMIKDTKNANQKEINKLKNLLQQQDVKIEKFSNDFKSALKELSWVVDDINSKFISKSEVEKLINSMNKKIYEINKHDKRAIKSKKSTSNKSTNKITKNFKINTKLNNWELQAKADKFYKNRDFSNLKKISQYLLEHNFKPAKNNFYIGEVNYNSKYYSKAISSYKISLKIYDQASYTPVLLLHSGKSLIKLGQKTQAKKFFELIGSNFPNSKEVKEAQKYL